MLYSRTVKGFGGTFVHQDSDGRIIGSSKSNPFNSKEYFHYNAESVMCGRSSPNFGGGYMHYDANRCYIGRSEKFLPFICSLTTRDFTSDTAGSFSA